MGPGPKFKLSLPANLVKELESQDGGSSHQRRRNQQASRKDQRKAQRVQKKQLRKPQPHTQQPRTPQSRPTQPKAVPSKRQPTPDSDGTGDEDEDEDDGVDGEHGATLSDLEDDVEDDDDEDDEDDDGDLSMLDDESDGDTDEADDIEDYGEDVMEPLPHSKSASRKLAQDDAEIAALEKKLGLKKGSKSLPKAFDEDGLGDLLGDMSDGGSDGQEKEDNRKRKAEADEWLAQKRRKAQAAEAANDNEDSDGDGAEFGGFSDDNDDDGDEEVRPQRENPYVAPATNVAKYVPPSLRRAQSGSGDQVEAQLRKRIQGLINRLTSDNMVGITKDVVALFSSNPRQLVTSILADILMALVCSPEKRPDAFFVMIAGFVAAIHRAMGMAVAAHFIQHLVQSLSEHRRQASGDHSDAPSKHLVTLLSELYNMQVISCVLIFDYVRQFLENLSELNTELLLRIIQHCGPALRREDPHALSEIINRVKPASLQSVSVRTSFMMDEMKKLQSNKTKAVTRNRDLADQRAQAKKRIGTLSSATDVQPFRIGLRDIENADKNGKWWLVGASWSGAANKTTKGEATATQGQQSRAKKEVEKDEDNYFSYLDVDFWQLAKEQGFNTEVRQRIFVALQTATDYEHAELLIRNLRLNKHQRKETAEVIVRSAERQSEYNPYYTLVAAKICGYKELAFQFRRSLAVRFGKMGEDVDTGEGEGYDADDAAEYDMRHLYNAAKMYGSLVARGALRLTDMLKYRNLTRLQEKAHMFVEVLLITVLQECDAEMLQHVVGKTDMDVAQGVQYFIKKYLRKTDLLQAKNEKKQLKQACETASDILQARLREDDDRAAP